MGNFSAQRFGETAADAEPLALSWRAYRRSFRQPLPTARGTWTERHGAIARLETADGRVGFGEIAPLPDFGSETLPEAIAVLEALGDRPSRAQLAAVCGASPPETRWPACQFALESALDALDAGTVPGQTALPPERLCALLPRGTAAIAAWPDLWARGHRTFKWKLDGAAGPEELASFAALARSLPPSARLRLDANGSLDPDAARRWLEACDRAGQVEFLEQPLGTGPADLAATIALAAEFRTPLALDESAATAARLRACCDLGWRGLVVLKPAIAGSPRRVRALGRRFGLSFVLSSAFETPVGRRAILALAEAWAIDRALGLGVDRWLEPLPQPWPEVLWAS